MRWYGVSVIYLDADVADRSVTAGCEACGAEDALDRVLSGHDLTWVRTGQQVVLMQRPLRVPPPVASVSGSVTDGRTGEAIGAANVSLHVDRAPGGTPLAAVVPAERVWVLRVAKHTSGIVCAWRSGP